MPLSKFRIFYLGYGNEAPPIDLVLSYPGTIIVVVVLPRFPQESFVHTNYPFGLNASQLSTPYSDTYVVVVPQNACPDFIALFTPKIP